MSTSTTAPLVQASFRHLVHHGRLTVQTPGGGSYTCPANASDDMPGATLAFRSRRAERRMLLDPGVALGELYMDSEIDVPEGTVYELLDLLFLNLNQGGGYPMGPP